ncbi:unnamed protein product [Pleuronectes platessa]|uniref:Uncharacterized protein n=1 Tax=Pleuronectes platessa TaxID=8262 RepID=A0A9N7ZD15_PLEPL|nr:unnamed protein product [Pleuronectes platessa]
MSLRVEEVAVWAVFSLNRTPWKKQACISVEVIQSFQGIPPATVLIYFQRAHEASLFILTRWCQILEPDPQSRLIKSAMTAAEPQVDEEDPADLPLPAAFSYLTSLALFGLRSHSKSLRTPHRTGGMRGINPGNICLLTNTHKAQPR